MVLTGPGTHWQAGRTGRLALLPFIMIITGTSHDDSDPLARSSCVEISWQRRFSVGAVGERRESEMSFTCFSKAVFKLSAHFKFVRVGPVPARSLRLSESFLKFQVHNENVSADKELEIRLLTCYDETRTFLVNVELGRLDHASHGGRFTSDLNFGNVDWGLARRGLASVPGS